MLQVGSVLDGKYKILNEIGHGGMSARTAETIRKW